MHYTPLINRDDIKVGMKLVLKHPNYGFPNYLIFKVTNINKERTTFITVHSKGTTNFGFVNPQDWYIVTTIKNYPKTSPKEHS